MTAFITHDPCYSCDETAVERETGWRYCRVHIDADTCPMYLAVQELSEKALASAAHWQTRIRHTPPDVRRDAIENEAGLFEQWAIELGAEFDAGAWVEMCGAVKVGVAA